MERQCLTCSFYQDIGPDWGQCRHDPPRRDFMIDTTDEDNRNGGWPEVYDDHWCGRYRVDYDRMEQYVTRPTREREARERDARERDAYLGGLSDRAEEDAGAEDTITSGSRAAAEMFRRSGGISGEEVSAVSDDWKRNGKVINIRRGLHLSPKRKGQDKATIAYKIRAALQHADEPL